MGVLRRLLACSVIIVGGPVMILVLQPAHAGTFAVGGWTAARAETEQLIRTGDYKKAFNVLDRYIKQRVARLYPDYFPLAAALRRRAYFRKLLPAQRTELIALWNAISMDAEEFGRDDPIVGYDYAAIGDAYAALNDTPRAESYYAQAVKVLIAACSRPNPVCGTFDLAASDGYFAMSMPPGYSASVLPPPR